MSDKASKTRAARPKPIVPEGGWPTAPLPEGLPPVPDLEERIHRIETYLWGSEPPQWVIEAVAAKAEYQR